MGEIGFYTDPAIDADTIAFVCDHAIWTARIGGGIARRRTPRISAIAAPLLDRGGHRLVFSASPGGPMQVCVVSSRGGRVRQLTHFQYACRTLGRAHDGRVVFCSPAGRPFRQMVDGWLIDVETGLVERMAAGPLLSYSAAGGAVVTSSPGVALRSWRGYRGGAKSDIFIDAHDSGHFRRITPVAGNVSSPVLYRGRVYFVSDEGDPPNLCSCNLDGGDLRQHTTHDTFAVHSLATDGVHIVYCAGADLFLFDGETGPRKLDIELAERLQGRREATRAVRPSLVEAAGSPDGRTMAWCALGTVFEWSFERSTARRLDTGRYCSRVACLPDGGLLAIVAGAPDDELLLIEAGAAHRRYVALNRGTGRVVAAAIASQGGRVVLANHRYELLGVHLETGKATLLARSFYRRIDQCDISSDGTLCVFALPVGLHRTVVHVVRCDDGRIVAATEPRFADFSPRFLPDGSVAFLSLQSGPPAGADMVTTVNLLAPPYHAVEACSRRLLVPPGSFTRLVTLDNSIAVLRPPAGKPRAELLSAPYASPRLWMMAADDVLPLGGQRFLVRAGPALHLGRWANGRPSIGGAETAFSELKARFDPSALRKSAVIEAWRIASDEVPVRAIGSAWAGLRDRYVSLVDRACTTKDALDILNEMLGHLRLSHASITRPSPPAPPTQGVLGVDVECEGTTGAYRIAGIPSVDPHAPLALGLANPALGARVGDRVATIDGVRVTSSRSTETMLKDKAGRQVRCELTGDDLKPREVVFEALPDDQPLRYAAWVYAREQLVARATGGQTGYLHIPDVNAQARTDVERWVWCHEAARGVIVDLRFNEGGMYGGEIAEFLARPAIARVRTRWSSARAIPAGSDLRPIVILTNRFTVSGGELLAETLRLLASATIIGERTFGGALGQTNRRALPDGFELLLPEIEVTAPAEWAQIENRGVVPDLEVSSTADAETADPWLVLALQAFCGPKQDSASPVAQP